MYQKTGRSIEQSTSPLSRKTCLSRCFLGCASPMLNAAESAQNFPSKDLDHLVEGELWTTSNNLCCTCSQLVKHGLPGCIGVFRIRWADLMASSPRWPSLLPISQKKPVHFWPTAVIFCQTKHLVFLSASFKPPKKLLSLKMTCKTLWNQQKNPTDQLWAQTFKRTPNKHPRSQQI